MLFFFSPLPLLFCLPSPTTLPFPFSNGGSCSWLPLDVSPKTPSKRFPPVSIQSYSRFVRAHERVPSTPSLPFRNLFYSISSTFFFFFYTIDFVFLFDNFFSNSTNSRPVCCSVSHLFVSNGLCDGSEASPLLILPTR